MSYKVEFKRSAKKEFDQLPKRIQIKVVDALTLLSQNAQTELLNIRSLKGAINLFRIRLGDFRIVYEMQKKTLLILIIKIGHRKEVYRRIK